MKIKFEKKNWELLGTSNDSNGNNEISHWNCICNEKICFSQKKKKKKKLFRALKKKFKMNHHHHQFDKRTLSFIY